MMNIETFIAQDRAHWLRERKKDVTGSEVGALFGLHRHKTALAVYAEKTLPYKEPEDAGGPTLRGVRLEKYVADFLRERGDFQVVQKSNLYYRDPALRIGGTPDYHISMDRGHGILEIKTIGQRDFVDLWRGGDPEGDIIPEPWQLLQVQTYMYLTGSEFGKIAVLPVSDWGDLEPHVIDVPRKEQVIEQIKLKVAQFWEMVKYNTPPDVNWGKDSAAVKALYAHAKPGKEMQCGEDLQTAINALLEYREKEAQAKRSKEEMDTWIRSRIGDAEIVYTPTGVLTAKDTHRKGYTVNETTFRTLRFKPNKIMESL